MESGGGEVAVEALDKLSADEVGEAAKSLAADIEKSRRVVEKERKRVDAMAEGAETEAAMATLAEQESAVSQCPLMAEKEEAPEAAAEESEDQRFRRTAVDTLESLGWTAVRPVGYGTSAVVMSAVAPEDLQNILGSAALAVKAFRNEGRYSKQAEVEAAALQETDGRWCVRLLLQQEVQGQQILVLEQLTCTLRKVITEVVGLLEGPLLLMLATQLLQALAALHAQGWVHGDVKPSNIMWSTEHEALRLIDLALGRRLEADKAQPVKGTAQPLQSPGYQAPEVVAWNASLLSVSTSSNAAKRQRRLSVAHKCMNAAAGDAWAAGCVLLQLFTQQQLGIDMHRHHVVGQALLDQRLDELLLQQPLSDRLRSTVKGLLCWKSETRCGCEAAAESLLQEWREATSPSANWDPTITGVVLPTCTVWLFGLLTVEDDQDEREEAVNEVHGQCVVLGLGKPIDVRLCAIADKVAVQVSFGDRATATAAQAAFSGMSFDGRHLGVVFGTRKWLASLNGFR